MQSYLVSCLCSSSLISETVQSFGNFCVVFGTLDNRQSPESKQIYTSATVRTSHCCQKRLSYVPPVSIELHIDCNNQSSTATQKWPVHMVVPSTGKHYTCSCSAHRCDLLFSPAKQRSFRWSRHIKGEAFWVHQPWSSVCPHWGLQPSWEIVSVSALPVIAEDVCHWAQWCGQCRNG